MPDATKVSKHAQQRMSQRSIRDPGVDLILDHGTWLGDDTCLLTERDSEREIRFLDQEMRVLQRELRRLNRLTGCWRNAQVGALAAVLDENSSVRQKVRLLRDKRELLRRMTNCKLVVEGGVLITVCRSDARDRKRLLRSHPRKLARRRAKRRYHDRRRARREIAL